MSNLRLDEIIIRKAEFRDRANLAKLAERNTAYHVHFGNMKLVRNRSTLKEQKKDIRRALRDDFNHRVLVARYRNKLIGYIIAAIAPPNPFLRYKRTGIIEDFYVEPGFRGIGIGRMIFSQAVAWLTRKRVDYVTVLVNARNVLALKAWKSFGFGEVVKKMALNLSR